MPTGKGLTASHTQTMARAEDSVHGSGRRTPGRRTEACQTPGSICMEGTVLGSHNSTFPPKKQLPCLHAREQIDFKWLQIKKEPLSVIDHLLITPALGVQLVNKITG